MRFFLIFSVALQEFNSPPRGLLMRPELEKRLAAIRRFSLIFKWVCQGLFVLLTLLLVICVVGIIAGGDVSVTAFDISLPVRSLVLRQRILLAIIGALGLSVPLKGLYHLVRLFRDFAKDKFFTSDSAGQIRQLGVTALLWAAANFVWIAVAFAFADRHLPRVIYFHADSIVIGATVIVVSWFMEMAAEMREENELTI